MDGHEIPVRLRVGDGDEQLICWLAGHGAAPEVTLALARLLSAAADTLQQHRRQTGRCGAEAPTIVHTDGHRERRWCALPHGHPGWHRGDDDGEWITSGEGDP